MRSEPEAEAAVDGEAPADPKPNPWMKMVAKAAEKQEEDAGNVADPTHQGPTTALARSRFELLKVPHEILRFVMQHQVVTYEKYINHTYSHITSAAYRANRASTLCQSCVNRSSTVIFH